MNKNLCINGRQGWMYEFRKLAQKPVEFRTYHHELGDSKGWVVAKNYCLKGLISTAELAEYFGLSVWQYRHGTN